MKYNVKKTNTGEGIEIPLTDVVEGATYYKNIEDRVIYIEDDIDENIIKLNRFIAEINRQDKDLPIEVRKPIKIFIYSYGGDGQACFSFIDTISVSKTPVYTYNVGVAMSAGLLIFLSGHKRYCYKNSIALIHSGSGGTQGTYEQTEAQMKDYKRFVDNMRNYILNRTDIDQKTFNKYKNSEWYIYSEDQIKFGICHAIVNDIDDII